MYSKFSLVSQQPSDDGLHFFASLSYGFVCLVRCLISNAQSISPIPFIVIPLKAASGARHHRTLRPRGGGRESLVWSERGMDSLGPLTVRSEVSVIITCKDVLLPQNTARLGPGRKCSVPLNPKLVSIIRNNSVRTSKEPG
jgi:hypothetical protein